jgi:hypothetical protein
MANLYGSLVVLGGFNATTITTNVAAAQLSLSGITISGAGSNTDVGITLTPKGAGDLTLDGLKWPQADGTAGYILKTDGAAQLSWVAQTLGDVVGPAGATANAIPRYNSTTGKLIKDSSVVIDDSNNVTGVAAITATTANATTITTNVATAQLSVSGITISGAGSNAAVGITLTPKGAGDLTLDGLKWPQADGTAGYVLKTDGAGQLSWVSTATGDVVGPASSTDNALARYDLATGKLIQNSGIIVDDSNNVTGVVALTGTTLNGTTITTNVAAAQLSVSGITISGAGTDPNVGITLTPKANGDLTLDGLKWPQADGTAGYVLKTNGSAQLSWVAQTSGDVVGPASATDNAIARFDLTTGKIIQGSSVIIDDSNNVTGVAAITATTANATTITTNVAAAQLSASGITISGAGTDANVGITLTPKAAGDLTLDGLKWPQADGTAGYVLKTDGAAQLSWVAQPSIAKYPIFDADVNTAWGAASGGFYTRTITAATHGKVDPMVTVMEYDGTNLDVASVDRIRITKANGDVALRVPETPDGRFRAGIYIF